LHIGEREKIKHLPFLGERIAVAGLPQQLVDLFNNVFDIQ